MSDLRTRALQQADVEYDLQFFGSSTATTLVNSMMSAQYGDLYSAVAEPGLRYFETSTTFTTPGGTNTWGEPVDHYATVDTIERVIAPSGRLRRLRQMQPQERAMWAGRTGHARRYELVDDTIYLYPTPPANDVYILRYVNQPPDLQSYADSALVDVVSPYGEQFMIWGTAVRILAKIKSDASVAMSERDAAREKLVEWAAMRAFNDPPRMMVEDEDDYFEPYRDGEWWLDR
jgi:hypothetical protein